MRRRRALDNESGASLVMAIAVVTLVYALVTSLLSYASTNFHSTIAISDQRDESYIADGAMDGAIQYWREALPANTALWASGAPFTFSVVIDGTTVNVVGQFVGDALDLDRSYSLEASTVVAAVSTPRVRASVIYRRGASMTVTPGVDITAWTYLR